MIWKSKNIGDKTTIRIISLVLVTVLVTGIPITLVSLHFLQKQESESLTQELLHEARLLEATLLPIIEKAKNLGKHPDVIANLINPARASITDKIAQNLEEVFSNNLHILDSKGRHIVSVAPRKWTDSPMEPAILTASTGKVHIFTDSNKGSFLSVPILIYDSPQGAILFEFQFQQFGEKFVPTHPNRLKEFYIGNQKLFSKGSIAEGKWVEKHYNFVDSSLLKDAKIDLVVRRSLLPFEKTKENSILLISGILILSLGFSLLFSASLSDVLVKPILTLIDRVKKGEACSPLNTEDELEQLAEAFDTKSQELESAKDHLEEKVAERTAELVKANDKALKALSQKSEFLANMSHEIRTPLNGIIGIASNLAEEPLESKTLESINLINESGNLLLAIINDILDMSKIESKKLAFENIDFSLADLVKNNCQILKQNAEKKKISLIVECSDSLPSVLKGDPTRIGQIIFNLVGNAIKFTNEGHVKVSLQWKKKDDHSGICYLKIEDTGIGILKERIDKLFKPFTQADSTTTRKFGGTGLGLTISSELCKMMGGSLSVESELAKGSVFTVELPMKVSTQKVIQKTTIQKALVPIRNLTVLVAEDNLLNQRVVRSYLSKLSLQCDIVPNGAEAIERVKSYQYDLIFMDMQMPIMGGIEATQKIRELNMRKPPIIVGLTANAMAEHKDACYAAGMNGFLAKPVTKKAIIEEMERLGLFIAPSQAAV